MSAIIKPMLAPNDEFDAATCRLPKMASCKIDGFRMFNQQGTAYTRSGKPMANLYTQALFSRPEFDGLDGELVIGEVSDTNVFNNSQGPLRTKTGEPKAVWWIFDDRTNMSLPFSERIEIAMKRVAQIKREMGPYADLIQLVPHTTCEDVAQIEAYESAAVESGFEGIMLRDPAAPYKAGRATYKENTFLKVKRLTHDEALITGFEEQLINNNDVFYDELGRLKRSVAKEGLVPSGLLGAFWMKSDNWAEPFKVSASSLTHDQKKEAFEKFDEMYKDQVGAFKYFGHGTLNAPRQGVFKGLRSALDMSE